MDKLIQIDGEDMCWCNNHKKYFSCSEFTRNNRNKHGYQNQCKVCLAKNRAGVRGDDYIENETDMMKAHILLQRLGYNIESETPIHQQFKEKFNL
jgi:hypothetical protein